MALISRANHVRTADTTYMPMARSFLYVVAVMDRHGRVVGLGSVMLLSIIRPTASQ